MTSEEFRKIVYKIFRDYEKDELTMGEAVQEIVIEWENDKMGQF